MVYLQYNLHEDYRAIRIYLSILSILQYNPTNNMSIFRRYSLFRLSTCSQSVKVSMPMPVYTCGINTTPRATLQAYAKRRILDGDKHIKQSIPLISSIQNLKRTIEEEPLMKMGLEGGLESIPPGGILHGKTPEEIYHMLSSICVSPPKFENMDLIGIPIFCLFVDFLNTRYGQAFFANPLTNYHLKKIFKDYQTMLESKVSLKYMTEEPNGWFSKQAQEKINYAEYEIDKSKPHWGFRNWNDWFTRHIRPQCRPIDEHHKAIVHSSDSYPLTYPPGSNGRNPVTNVKGDSRFWLKDNLYSLHDMFESKKMGLKELVDDHFVGGTVYQAFLDPCCYHRWHSPVSGTIIYSYKLNGQFYLQNPAFNISELDNYIKSQPMLSVVNNRHIFIIQLDDGSGRLVAMVEIGMGEVSGCQPTAVQTQFVRKGDELGYFAFGGSSYAMVFDKRFDLKFNEEVFVLDRKDRRGQPQPHLQKVNSLLCTFK